MRKLLLVVGFFPAAIATLGTSLYLFIKLPKVREVDILLRQQAHLIKSAPLDYTAASFIPQVLGSFTEAIRSEDARPIIIRNYLQRYNSPLTPYAKQFVDKADEYGLKYYQLPVAIAQQESNLGKKTPPNCYNAWGWGIHSEGTLCFPDWPTAIDQYIKGLTEKYGDILAIENEDKMLYELMKRYAPISLENSNGSWAKGIKQFMQEMQ